jgi:hypothetical protein
MAPSPLTNESTPIPNYRLLAIALPFTIGIPTVILIGLYLFAHHVNGWRPWFIPGTNRRSLIRRAPVPDAQLPPIPMRRTRRRPGVPRSRVDTHSFIELPVLAHSSRPTRHNRGYQ